MSAQLNAGMPAAAAPAASSLLDQIVEQSKVAKSASEHARARDLIAELVNQVLDGTVLISNNLSATLDARVAELDRLISAQLRNHLETRVTGGEPFFASEVAGRYLQEAVFGPGARNGWQDTVLGATGETLDPYYFVKSLC